MVPGGSDTFGISSPARRAGLGRNGKTAGQGLTGARRATRAAAQPVRGRSRSSSGAAQEPGRERDDVHGELERDDGGADRQEPFQEDCRDRPLRSEWYRAASARAAPYNPLQVDEAADVDPIAEILAALAYGERAAAARARANVDLAPDGRA